MTNFFPKGVQYWSEGLVSFRRVQEFFELPELAETSNRGELGDDEVVRLEKAAFGWGSLSLGKNDGVKKEKKKDKKDKTNDMDSDNTDTDSIPLMPLPKVILHDLNLNIKKGTLVGVVGPVGSGKSSFLNSLLGEMNLLSGSSIIQTGTKIAYFSQTPWLLSGTIRENITFGTTFDAEWFKMCVEACALDRDLQRFPDGDLTVIGERGVTLSGGQRARVQLARVLYRNADLIILDDPLSAVDTNVGRHIFEKGIKEFLKGKTVILNTHQLQFMKDVDKLLVMEHGKIAAYGDYHEVIGLVESTHTDLHSRSNTGQSDEGMMSFIHVLKEFEGKNTVSKGSGDLEAGLEAEDIPMDQKELIKKAAAGRTGNVSNEDATERKELTKEERASGVVKGILYWEYVKAGAGLFLLIVLIFFMFAGEALLVVTDWWLARWSIQSFEQQRQTIYPALFGGFVVVTVVLSMARAIMFFMLALKSNTVLFHRMLRSALRSPIYWFQTQPQGRVLNRFVKDLTMSDEILVPTFYDFMQCLFMIVGTVILTLVYIPWVALVLPILAVAFFYLRKFYLLASRQMKRLESTTRSPVYSSISTTLDGIASIRAFEAQDRFLHDFKRVQNQNTKMYFQFLQCARWVGFRLDQMSALIVTVVAFFCVGLRGDSGLEAGVVGLILSYSIQLLGLVQWCIRQSSELENLMVSIERIMEYTQLPSEAPEITDTRPPDNWPSKGAIEIENLSLTYTGTSKPVLKNIHVRIPAGEKIGIVGRTGAGKSTFLTALFRLVEPASESRIVIDGVETLKLGLKDLRSRLSIIPQEPVLFKGSLRFNVDPFAQYGDKELWKVLSAVELKRKVSTLPDKLETMVEEGGANWSHGERQLICLARALLKRSKVVVMDEATSSVDMRTDKLIQKAIRGGKKKVIVEGEGGDFAGTVVSQASPKSLSADAGDDPIAVTTSDGGLFEDATVCTIAHRLNTIIDYDKILVLHDGELVEMGTPHELLNKPLLTETGEKCGWFRSMVAEMGPEAEQVLRDVAEKKFLEEGGDLEV